MLWIWNSPEVRGFSSTFILPNATRPEYSFASCSTMGATIRQGPHHAAQKSTTISGYFEISEEKVASERIIGLLSYFSADWSWARVLRIISTSFLSFMLWISASSSDNATTLRSGTLLYEWLFTLLRSSCEGEPLEFVARHLCCPAPSLLVECPRVRLHRSKARHGILECRSAASVYSLLW